VALGEDVLAVWGCPSSDFFFRWNRPEDSSPALRLREPTEPMERLRESSREENAGVKRAFLGRGWTSPSGEDEVEGGEGGLLKPKVDKADSSRDTFMSESCLWRCEPLLSDRLTISLPEGPDKVGN